MRCHLTKTEMKDLFSMFQNTNLKVILSKFEIAEEFLNHDHDCILKSLKERQMEVWNLFVYHWFMICISNVINFLDSKYQNEI